MIDFFSSLFKAIFFIDCVQVYRLQHWCNLFKCALLYVLFIYFCFVPVSLQNRGLDSVHAGRVQSSDVLAEPPWFSDNRTITMTGYSVGHVYTVCFVYLFQQNFQFLSLKGRCDFLLVKLFFFSADRICTLSRHVVSSKRNSRFTNFPLRLSAGMWLIRCDSILFWSSGPPYNIFSI